MTQLKYGGLIETEFSRGNSNGQETLKEMFNILSHQGNANQNYFEISFYNILHHSEWLRSTEQMTAHAVEDVE